MICKAVGHRANVCVQVCEISETASDAWSTDVLASDTSERQSERLLELEQVSLQVLLCGMLIFKPA